MPNRTLLICGAVGVLALVATACGSSAGTGSGSSGGIGAAITFAAPVSLDGPLSVEGQLTDHGYKYCVSVVNNHGGITFGGQKHHLNLVTQDDQSDPSHSATVVDRFNDQGYKFILSPYGSAATSKVAPVVERNGQIMLDSNGADPSIFSQGYTHTFGVLSLAPEYGAAIIDAFASMTPAPKTVAVISADDGFSQSSASGVVKEAQAKGMTVVPSPMAYQSTTKVPANATDVHSALEAIASDHPDVIVITGHFNEPTAAIKQGQELNIKPKMGYGVTVAVGDSKFSALGTVVNGVVGSTQWVPTVTTATTDHLFGTAKQFAQAYAQVYPGDAVSGVPGYQAVEATAACEALVKGVEKAGSTDPSKVRDALATLSFDSFYGHIQFDRTGANSSKPMEAIQIQGEPSNVKLVTIWPSSMTSGPPVWPAIGS
jgi:branched-chain amino acid transport system substrate-binding protein